MSVRTDVINLNVNVNGNKAQADLNNLKKRAADVKFEMDGLKKGTAAYIAKKKELSGITDEMGKLKKQIGITALSQKELNRELATLKALRGSVAPFSAEFKDLDKQIKAVENRLYDVKNGVTGFSSFFSKISTQVKQFGLVAAGYLGFQFITSQFSNIISGAGKLSDSLADVRRVTGLTASETDNLNAKLKELDTRTSTEGLRNIVIIAGKLGVAKDQLLDFTVAVDKLVVALGDELGDANTITTQLGKILNVFDGSVNGDNISRLGNAIVDLANKGVASGGFIVDFTQRLAGLAGTANLSLDASIGLAAGLEEIGQRSESASTAVINILGEMGNNVDLFAKAAGKDVTEFGKTIQEKPVEALLQLAEGVTKNKSGLAQLSPVFKNLGIDGVRVQTVLGAVGNKTDFFRKKIEESGAALKSTSAINDAFILKNETFGATLDKIGKKINSVVANSPLAKFIQGLVTGFGKLIGAVESTNTPMQKFLELQGRVRTLERDLLPLIDRYDELRIKANELGGATKLGKDEQVELHKAIQTIATNIPFAIAEFDKYGNAIAISSIKAREFIDLQRSILRVKNAEEIKSTQNTVRELEKQIAYNQKWAEDTRILSEKNTKRWAKDEADRIRIATQGNNEIQKILNRNLGLRSQLIDQQNFLRNLNGEDITAPGAVKPTTPFIPVVTPTTPSKDTSKKDKADQLKKEADDFRKEMEKLRRDLEIGGMQADEAEIARIQDKYKDLLARAKKYNFDLLALEGFKYEEIQRLMDKSFKEQEEKAAAENYELALQRIQKEADAERKAALELYSQGLLTKKQYEAALTSIDEGETAKRIAIHKVYSDRVKAAGDNFVADRKKQEAQVTADLLDQAAARERIRKLEADADANIGERDKNSGGRRNRRDAAISAAKGLRDERINNLRDELEAAGEVVTDELLEETSVFTDANEAFQESLKAANTDFVKGMADDILQGLQFTANALGSIFQIIANKENKILADEKRRNDEKGKAYKKQLDNKLISQAQYDLKVQQLQEEQDRKEREIRRKQAKREKSLNIFQSLINTGSAVVEALPNIPLSIAVGILGALQTGIIATTPLPELGDGDWLRSGPKHKEKGRGTQVLIERDEAVMKAAAMTSDKQYTVSGTTAQITSALNSMAGGANWANGAVIEMAKWRSERPASINPNMPRIMEQGGVVRPLPGSEATGSTERMEALLSGLLEEQKANTAEIINMKRDLHAKVSIKEFREEEAKYNAAKKVSGIKQ